MARVRQDRLGRVGMSVFVDEELWKEFRVVAALGGTTSQQLLEEAVKQIVERAKHGSSLEKRADKSKRKREESEMNRRIYPPT